MTSLAGHSHARPVVNEDIVGDYGGGTGPAWGYHGYEYALTLGNLLRDVAGEEAARGVEPLNITGPRRAAPLEHRAAPARPYET